jgi:hypothetical protein
MLRASLGKVVHTVKRAGTYAAKVSHKELHKIAVHVRAVNFTLMTECTPDSDCCYSVYSVGYTLHVHTAGVGEMNTQCTSILQVMSTIHWTS